VKLAATLQVAGTGPHRAVKLDRKASALNFR